MNPLSPSRILVAVTCLSLLWTAAAAPLPAQEEVRLLPFQGVLTDQNGAPVADDVRTVLFQIFDAPASGNLVWGGELHTLSSNGGLVSTLLGTKNALDPSAFSTLLYLQITFDVNGDRTINEADPPMLPRQLIVPTIQAYNTGTLEGRRWSDFFEVAPGSPGSSNPADNPENARVQRAGMADTATTATAAMSASNAGALDGFDWSSILEAGGDPTAPGALIRRDLIQIDSIPNSLSGLDDAALTASDIGKVVRVDLVTNKLSLAYWTAGSSEQDARWGIYQGGGVVQVGGLADIAGDALTPHVNYALAEGLPGAGRVIPIAGTSIRPQFLVGRAVGPQSMQLILREADAMDAVVAPSGGVLLFGGFEVSPGVTSDLLAWTGGQWVVPTATGGLTERWWPATALDSTRQVVVLFGGIKKDDVTLLDDTWELTAGEWRDIGTTGRPPARLYASLVFRASQNHCILFGGQGASGTLRNDTWSWNGTAWSQFSVASPPPARYNAAAAYDPARDKVVIWGGRGNGVDLNDTWEWDGSSWTQRVSSGDTPAGYEGASMAYDYNLAELLLFRDGSTWSWNGSRWLLRSSQGPGTRRYAHMAWSEVDEAIILFGGQRSGQLSDTWRWDGVTWGQVTVSNPPVAQHSGPTCAAPR